MELFLLNTPQGLKPLYDEDYDEKKKLKLGEVYRATIVRPRNILFHRKFFALVKVGFDNSKMVAHSIEAARKDKKTVPLTIDSYRKLALIKSGFANIYHTPKGIYVEAMSVSFESMSEEQFQEVYSKVLDFVILDTGADQEMFMNELKGFI